MFRRILSKLENPKRPLLGPNVKALKIWGLFLPDDIYMKCFYIVMHALTMLFTFTEYIDIWFIKSDLNVLLTNVKITLLATISCWKISSFLMWQSRWKDIIEYVTRTDLASRSSADSSETKLITEATRYCRKITYLYWFLMATTDVVVIVQPVAKFFASTSYRENVREDKVPLAQIVSSWVPFDKTTSAGFLLASAYQTFAAIYGGGWITSYDTNAMTIMVFFKMELQLIKSSCVKIFNDADDKVVLDRITKCHNRHAELVKYAKLYNSCLSPVMFLYMVVCSIMLCASVYQTSMETNPLNRLLIAEYLVFGITQLLIYCWHGNEVAFMSNEVMRGVYESGWWQRCVGRKELILLTGQLDHSIRFSAGPFFELTIAVFLNIIKGAYSYYTLITNQEKGAQRPN